MPSSLSTRPPSSPAVSRRHAGRLTAATVAAAMVFASGCSLPFADSGDDISAEVDVGSSASNIKTPDTTRENNDIGDGAARDGDDTPATASSAEGEAPTPSTIEAALAPLTSIDSRFNGRSMQYLGIDLQLGDFVTTNQTLQQYLGSLDPTDPDEVLLIELAVTNRSSGTVAVPRGVLGLRLPSGEWVPAEQMREADGDSVSTVRPATQATERVVLEFPSIDLVGASFEISEASTIAESIPLTPEETIAASPIFDMPGSVAVIGLESPSLWNSCGYSWTGEVLSARITVEGVDGRLLERATKGQRWVAIELRAVYDATVPTGPSPCVDYGIAVNELSPRLVIDGIPETSVNSVPGDRISIGTAATVEFWFQIPVETQEIELTDIAGTRIALWNLAIPLLDGEA